MNLFPPQPRCPADVFLKLILATVVSLTAAGQSASAGTLGIDFESPPFPAGPQPNNFLQAGAMQTYSINGVFALSGGVVLGAPTFLPAFTAGNGATLPNLYGTADFADPSLQSSITLQFPAAEGVTNVQGLLFNGQSITESYSVGAFGATGILPVDFQFFAGMAAATSGGFTNFSLSSSSANPITSIVITTGNANLNGWDFFVDSINVFTVPEPAPLALMLVGLGLAVGRRRGQRGVLRKERLAVNAACPVVHAGQPCHGRTAVG